MFLGNEMAHLVRPDESYLAEIVSYREEMLATESSMDGTGMLKRIEDPMEWLRRIRAGENPEQVSDGMVPATQFIMADPETKRIYGMLQVRQDLNEYLRSFAGHIGYSVRPTERRKGYAVRMLEEALEYCNKELGLEQVLVSCLVENEGSRKTILACGGMLEEKVYEHIRGWWLEKYWVPCSK